MDDLKIISVVEDAYKVIAPYKCDECGGLNFTAQDEPRYITINKTQGEDEDGWYVAKDEATMPNQMVTITCTKCDAVQDVEINCYDN